jgi:hypothetical protein
MVNKKKGELVNQKKPKGKPRGGNSPVIGNNGLMLKEGDNAKILNLNRELFKMPNIDYRDIQQVEDRLDAYFALYAKYDMKPTVAGMAMALNMSRQTLWAVAHNQPVNSRGDLMNLPTAVADSIKKSYFLLENMWETYMNSGKVNPVSGIFLGKNNFGYKDTSEYVLTPNKQVDEYSPEDIKKKYLTGSDSSDSNDSGSE